MAVTRVLAKRGTAAQIVAVSSANQLAGEIAFATDTKDFYVSDGTQFNKITDLESNGNFYVSGNVGIGTTSPSYKLDVAGDIRTNQYLYLGLDTSLYRDGINILRTDDAFHANGNIHVGSGGYIYNRANTNSYIKFTSPNISMIGGNVGIGTTSPSQKLQVYEGDIMLNSGYALHLTTTADHTKIQRTNNALELYAGSNPRMHIADGGKVGIGTTSPTEKLHVVGNIKIEDLNPTIKLLDTNGADWDIELEDNHLRFKVGSTKYVRFQNGGNVGIGTTSPGARLQINGSTSDTTATALAVRNSSLTSLFSIRNDGRVDIPAGALVQSGGGYANTSTSSSYFTGNLGVGTTSPAAKLEIVHTDAGKDTLVLGRTDNSSYWKVNHAGNDFRLYNRDSSGADILFGVDAGSITQNNRVGIGTATPSAKLDVAGDVATTGNITVTKSSASIKVIETGGGDVRMTAGGATGYIGTYNNNSLQLVQNGSVALFVDTSRRVGIGTTSPTTALQVVGRTKTSELHASNGNAIYTNQGSVAVGTSQVDSSAVLNIVSTTKGVLFPRMTETQRDAIEEPTTGLIVYQTDGTEGLYIYKSTGWTQII